MKCLLSIYLSLSMIIHSHVYISDQANGHKVEFLILSRDSVILETYTIRHKLPIPLSRKIHKHPITNRLNGVIKTAKFDIIEKSNNALRIKKNTYYRDLIIENPGDFFHIDSSFGYTDNHNRLKSCRVYFANQEAKSNKSTLMSLKNTP